MITTGHSISHRLPCPVPSWVPSVIGNWGGDRFGETAPHLPVRRRASETASALTDVGSRPAVARRRWVAPPRPVPARRRPLFARALCQRRQPLAACTLPAALDLERVALAPRRCNGQLGITAAESGREWPRAAESGRERPRAADILADSSRERPRAAESGRERPTAAESSR